MASKSKTKNISFPAIRLTKRPTRGKRKVEYLYKGDAAEIETSTSTARVTSGLSQFEEANLSPPVTVSGPGTRSSEPTTFAIESKSAVVGWEKVRLALLNAVVEAAAMPLHQVCVLCNLESSLRCKQCGPISYYCINCFKETHAKVNFLHVAEKWEVNHHFY